LVFSGFIGFSPSSCPRLRFKRAGTAWHGRQSTHPPLGVSSSTTARVHRIGGRSGRAAAASRRSRKEPGAGLEQGPLHRRDAVDTPGRRRAAPEGERREPAGDKEQEPRRTTTGVNIYPAFVHLSTEPATTPPLPRSEQHRSHLMSFLPPCALLCFVPTALGCAVMSPCLVAGRRAAELPRRARAELSGHSCPRARRRHARTVCGCWPSRQACCAGACAPPCRRGALSSRGIPDPCSPPTRVERWFEPGFVPCVLAGVRRGAVP
jgi:hypothetical protein